LRYEGSNPSLCTIFLSQSCGGRQDVFPMNPAGNGRMAIALAVLAILAVLVWRTMEPGKMQQVTWLLLGFFAARVLLTRLRRDKVESGSAADSADDSQ
jgi:hypothetical protein